MTATGRENSIAKGWQLVKWEEEERLPAPQKLIILCAAPGNNISKEQNPNLPITPEEIVKVHVEGHKAGASIIHVHVRDAKGLPTADCEIYKRVILEIKEKCRTESSTVPSRILVRKIPSRLAWNRSAG